MAKNLLKKPNLYLCPRLTGMLFALIFLPGCDVGNRRPSTSEDAEVTKVENYVPTCPSENITCADSTSDILEQIMSVYIDQEGLHADNNFMYVSANCWTDTSYVIIMMSFKWQDKFDSLIYREASQITTFNRMTVCIDKGSGSKFPIPTNLEIKTKPLEVHERDANEVVPYNEYLNDLQFSYSPITCKTISVFDNGTESQPVYENLLRDRGLMQ